MSVSDHLPPPEEFFWNSTKYITRILTSHELSMHCMVSELIHRKFIQQKKQAMTVSYSITKVRNLHIHL